MSVTEQENNKAAADNAQQKVPVPLAVEPCRVMLVDDSAVTRENEQLRPVSIAR